MPSTPLLARALPLVDWSDAYAVPVPRGAPTEAQEWADLILHSPPTWIRVAFAAREALVGLVAIERAGPDVFKTVSSRPGELLIGTDQSHLGFRVSVLVQPERVVVSTVVQVHNRRGRVYCAFVRRIHPFVVRSMLTAAARSLAALPG